MEIKASVVIADASEEYRTILKKTMESTGEFQVVGSAGSGVEALRVVQQLCIVLQEVYRIWFLSVLVLVQAFLHF